VGTNSVGTDSAGASGIDASGASSVAPSIGATGSSLGETIADGDALVSSDSPIARKPRPPYGVLLKLAYDGQMFSGLAIQSNARTVSGELQRAIRTLDPGASGLRMCSRTDAGVHATCQFVSFDTHQRISSRGWLLGLQAYLPPQIAVLAAGHIAPGFQPSRHAIRKTYRYSVLQGTLRDPFLEGRSWRVPERLNHGAMRREAELLIGTHDFRAFRGRADFRTNTTRTIESVSVEPNPEKARLLELSITGNAFLYHMVRIISGTLVDVGRGKLQEGAVTRAIQSGDRLDLGMTAPAAGLCLREVELSVRPVDEWPYHLDGAPADISSTPLD
jgi:tRNA pseudouridine38-40 synthase